MNRLIFGCGYLGYRVACQWRDRGDFVIGVTRSPERALELRGLWTIGADITQPETLTGFNSPRNLAPRDSIETVLFAVGHDKSSGSSIEDVHVTGLKNVLNSLYPGIRQFIYVSTTGV